MQKKHRAHAWTISGFYIGCSYQLGAETCPGHKIKHSIWVSDLAVAAYMHAWWTHTHTHRGQLVVKFRHVYVCVHGEKGIENKTQKSSLAPLYSLFRWLLICWWDGFLRCWLAADGIGYACMIVSSSPLLCSSTFRDDYAGQQVRLQAWGNGLFQSSVTRTDWLTD